MSNLSVYEELDLGIEAILLADDDSVQTDDPIMAELFGIARELRQLPSEEFRERLRCELEEEEPLAVMLPSSTRLEEEILPTLLGANANQYAVQRSSFAASLLLHVAAAALIATSGFWVVQRGQMVGEHTVLTLVEPGAAALPFEPTRSAGGGGGGDRDKMQAPKGGLPKISREQIAPPAMIVRNDNPRLPVEPTVVVPPNLKFPQMAMGDPMSGVVGPASNGTGSGGGIGGETGGGIGTGRGPGVGPGWGSGYGGGVYRVGGGVSAPRALFDPEPEYSDEARKAKYQGTVVLWVVIGADGRPRDVRVQRSLGMGLDERAIEAVKKWKFQPAMKDGQPVAVQVNIEVNFHLY